MNRTLTLAAATLLLTGCRHYQPQDIQGSWKIDSIQTFYNGFTMSTAAVGDEPVQHYEPGGKLRMTQGAEFRYFLYEIHEDTLTQFTTEHKTLETFTIVNINDNHLVLQKEKKPLFEGKQQRRYETRYFSRTQ